MVTSDVDRVHRGVGDAVERPIGWATHWTRWAVLASQRWRPDAARRDAVSEALASNARLVARFMHEGTVVPFLGGRASTSWTEPRAMSFRRGASLPSGAELASYLAKYFEYPDSAADLVRVSQYVRAS